MNKCVNANFITFNSEWNWQLIPPLRPATSLRVIVPYSPNSKCLASLTALPLIRFKQLSGTGWYARAIREGSALTRYDDSSSSFHSKRRALQRFCELVTSSKESSASLWSTLTSWLTQTSSATCLATNEAWRTAPIWFKTCESPSSRLTLAGLLHSLSSKTLTKTNLTKSHSFYPSSQLSGNLSWITMTPVKALTNWL